MSKIKLAIFVSGRGSNLKAIVNSDLLTDLVETSYVVSDKPDCKAFEFAHSRGIKTLTVGKYGLSFDEIAERLILERTGLVVLAGFLKLVPAGFVEKFENRIINIHPALLPSFGGKGMYGHFVHEAVFKSGAKLSGPTVHFVNNEYDKGYIIAQSAVDISMVKSPDEIAEKVLVEEHRLLPSTIALFAEQKIMIVDGRVRIV